MEYRPTPALFLDSDMIVRGDIAELFDKFDPIMSVQVVKNKERFEWPSLMLFNPALCKKLTPEYIEKEAPQTFDWALRVGDLPEEWNYCLGYDAPEKFEGAKLVHYTAGIPFFPEVQPLGGGDEFMSYVRGAVSSIPWKELMGPSVHAQRLARGELKRVG